MQGKPLRLWGRCPSMTTLEGVEGFPVALIVLDGADRTEVHDIGVVGRLEALALSGSTEVLFDRIWVHDTGRRGLNVEDALGPTSFVLSNSLFETMGDIGVAAAGASAVVESTTIRDSQSPGGELSGYGIAAQRNRNTGARAALTVKNSLIERTASGGVMVRGSDAYLESVLLRDTKPAADGSFGRGVDMSRDEDGEPSRGEVHSSVVERAYHTGIFLSGSEVTLDAVVVRDGVANTEQRFGWGVQVQDDEDGARGSLTVLQSVLERNREVGVLAIGADGFLNGVLVRDTLPSQKLATGRGVVAQWDENGQRAVMTIRDSVVERSSSFGIFINGSDATIESSLVRETRADANQRFGDGISLIAPPDAPATAYVTGTRIERSERAGISSFGSLVVLIDNELACSGFDAEGEAFGPRAFEFRVEDSLCGCPQPVEECQVLSAGLEPPPALEP